jgi:cytochrome c-type protein NapB
MTEQTTPTEHSSKAWLYCFVAVVFAVSLVGFFRGTTVEDHGLELPRSRHAGSVSKEDVPEARSYLEMRNRPPGKGSGWEESKKLVTPDPAADGAVRYNSEVLEAALRKRADLRAYDGAPPTIPHHVRQNSAAECMACHGDGLRLGALRAQTIPHDNFTNCTQCHVATEAPMPSLEKLPPDPRNVANTFRGLDSPRGGPRAWPIAPPQIPHTSFMRENCMSCHGPGGPQAMRSSHTSRQSCTQCHTSSAEIDLRPGLEASP